MGSKAEAGAVPPTPPPPPPPPPVCCMCGDPGLTQELFRCKLCLVRSQHRYCSNLYPKAESYRACNWCLREEGAKALSKYIHSTSMLSSWSSNGSGNGPGGAGEGSCGSGGSLKLHREAFSAQVNKPVKKVRLPDRSASDVTDRIRSGSGSGSGSDDVSPRLGRTRQPLRSKVRRYKLLVEVPS